ncbi:MAG: hypothetical protein KC729_12875 [Candidatus Eisenbacteria bacterium]|uniref:Uncharacterized protein n=1 Tax=Eiseniibacteriota bacterium TaxID=2212470 RepID=A0A956LZW1_UNCEI|nr:hypothetical protein [Candidatus Eisenbacteria bacterium]
MKDPLDPRIDMMMASLYGELSDEEEARFQRMLEEDPTLRAEWEDLQATRKLLGAWEIEERVPSFVIMDAGPETRTGRPVRPADSGPGSRWRALWQRYGTAAGWALAAAAALLAVLALAEFRIDLLDRGIAFRFGPPTAEMAPTATPQGTGAVPAVQSDVAASQQPNGAPETWIATGADSTRVQLTKNLGNPAAPLTRGEFDGYATAMAKVIAAMQSQNDYNSQESQEFIQFMRTMYDGLQQKQSQDYYDLRGRIESVRYGLDEVETNTNERFDAIDFTNGQSLTPQGVRPRRSEAGDADSSGQDQNGREE